MKKIVSTLSIITLSAFFSIAFAQGVGLGVRAGVNFANQSISNITTESRTGFLGGAYAILAFSEKWGIQPEVLFSSQGSELPNLDEISQFDYLSIPLLVRFKPAEFLSFEAGPQFSALLSAVSKDGSSIKDNFKGSDFGLAVGTTIHLPFGLNVGGRYIWGFTNVADLGNNTEVKNTTIQLFAGWTILGHK